MTLTYYFYCIIIDIMFNFLILLKMINCLGRYAALKLHFFASCHFFSCSRPQLENTSLKAEVNSSKWLNRHMTKNLMWISSKPHNQDEIQLYQF